MTGEGETESIKERFRRFLELRGLNLNQISVRSGKITPVGVGNIVRGKTRDPQLSTLVNIADGAGVSVGLLAQILSGEVEDPLEQPKNTTTGEEPDVILSASELTGADVQNLQLMVQLLRGIREDLSSLKSEIVENKVLLRLLTDRDSKEEAKEAPHAIAKRSTVETN